MYQDLSGGSTVTTSQARVAWITHGPRDMYLLYDQAHYHESFTPNGWWERTLALDPYHWFHLSGTIGTSPSEAVHAILQQRDRPAFTLPALIVALFLARSAQPNTLEQRQLFRWVASAILHMQRCLPPGSLHAGWSNVGVDIVEQSLSPLINGLLQIDPRVPWTLPDGAWFQVLHHLSDSLWRFPPYAIRAINSAVATAHEDEGSEEQKQHPSQLDAATALGYLSAIRFWSQPWPTIRGLPIRTSMLEFLPLWHQVLVIMDPNAPGITDAQLVWLCDGTIGKATDGPFDHLMIAVEESSAVGSSAAEWQEHIVMLRQEAVRGTERPGGSWEVQQPVLWPELLMDHVATLRIVVGAQGCWVRFIPAEERWGSVFWWRPTRRPPTCWSLALGEALTSPSLLALHATLWQMWRNLKVDGCPFHAAVRVA
jgi:hypothetical protein